MPNYSNEFIDEITQVSPNDLVTDETQNLITNELQSNIKYLINLLSATTTNSSNGTNQSSENLLNYDSNGNKTSNVGGTFDTFENKNSWTAVQDNSVVNETKVENSPLDLLIYSGLSATIESGINSNSWIEREFYIPPQLRGTSLLFAIKGTGLNLIPTSTTEYPYCNVSTVPGVFAVGVSGDGCIARYEDVVISIKGTENDITSTKTLGPWPQYAYFSQEEWAPAYRSIFIPIKTGTNTSSIKIKIIRTQSDGAIAISNMILVALPAPFDTYDFNKIDINELYDFKNNILKFNSTTVNGKHVSQSSANNKLSEIITKEQFLQLSQYNKDISFDWDQISGPRLIEVNNSTEDSPKISAFEFDPGYVRYLHFNMKTNAPSPGTCCLSFNYFISENEFSNTITCNNSGGSGTQPGVIYPPLDCTTINADCYNSNSNLRMDVNSSNYCKNVKLDIYYKTINPGETANPDFSTFNKLTYIISIPINLIVDGNLGHFEIYNDFFSEIKNNVRGAITLFSISRNGTDPTDTFDGNFLIGATQMSVSNPPDDIPAIGTYTINNPC